MKILSSAARIDVCPTRHVTAESPAEELERLRAQVARLKTERTALLWAVGHDELTGLPNRRLLYSQAATLLDHDRAAVVAMIDLNGFKPINDAFGHETGDRVLRVVARRLAGCPGIDMVARLGGDEFAAVISDTRPEGRDGWWRPVVAAIASAIAEPMPIAGRELRVTASIGVAPVLTNAPLDELLSRADVAMYRAKSTGCTPVVWGEPDGTGTPAPGDRLVLEFLLFPAGTAPAGSSSVAGTDPAPDPSPAGGVPAGDNAGSATADAGWYRRGDPVWVHRDGAWRPGIVESASDTAVLATYRCSDGLGTLVDTLTATRVRARLDADAHLDRNYCQPGVAA